MARTVKTSTMNFFTLGISVSVSILLLWLLVSMRQNKLSNHVANLRFDGMQKQLATISLQNARLQKVNTTDCLTGKIPIIFVSAMDDSHNGESGFKAGAVDYINRQTSLGVGHARIKVHLENSRKVKFIEALASGYLSDFDKIRIAAKYSLNNT